MAEYVHVHVEDVADIEVYAAGEPSDFIRPCVTCGLNTGSYCDGLEYHAAGPAGPGGPANGPPCMAADRVPSEQWVAGKRTPFCTRCEAIFVKCRFCLGVFGPTPLAHGPVPR
jgi:hypothetical protein